MASKPRKPIDLGLDNYNELFMNEQERMENRLPRIYTIPISEIDEFPDHPFQVRMDEDMDQLVESVKERGVITPVTLRKKEDCSTLCRTAYRDCGLNSMNGLSSVRMAQKCLEMGCLFTDASQLQAGDLIFFASLDPSRGKDYCRDRRRCGDGKCRRWMRIHHVAIYINDEFLIDSTGGDNSVQIRRLYGQDTKTLKWVCFGRPTT